MRLVSVYKRLDGYQVLYDLLIERTEVVNISHKVVPNWVEHIKFVESRPYRAWYLIVCGDCAVGAVYLTNLNEIGVGILKAYRGQGYASQAVRQLIFNHPAPRFLANINPRNEPSKRLFASLGFVGPIQETWEMRTK